ncbi:MAG: HNH endonuclease family protein, partial [Ruminiclostridium sp.]|nr:HNH endonuclease family protein [Ruminiclostridium sp.]
NYLILRLDSFVSDSAASYKTSILTIEHVLPQTVSEGSEWERIWDDKEEREFWLNKIGNLIPLTKRHNSKAQNYDFKTKKEKYFKSSDTGVTSYALATDVLNYAEWTPDIVKERQQKLIEVYKKGWDLTETTVETVSDNSEIVVVKTITINDVRARILRIPAAIRDRIPVSMSSYNVVFNGELYKELTLSKERDYFAKITTVYKKFGLIDGDDNFTSKQITWKMDVNGDLSAKIE